LVGACSRPIRRTEKAHAFWKLGGVIECKKNLFRMAEREARCGVARLWDIRCEAERIGSFLMWVLFALPGWKVYGPMLHG
jgi:hypothetical protein